MKPRLLLWGAGGHAKVVADIVRREGSFEIACCLVDVAETPQQEALDGIPIIHGRHRIPELTRDGIFHVVPAFSDCARRLALMKELPHLGLSPVSAIHPSAVVAEGATIAPGSVVAAGAIINPGATVGPGSIVNTAASIDHDCSIGAATHIAPGARLAGHVHTGEAAWIGIGAIISNRLTVGARSIIGAGAVVVSDIPPDVVAYGCPAKVIRPVTAQR